MTFARLSMSCAAALLLLAAPVAAQQAAPADTSAARREPLAAKPLSSADREKFAGDYDIVLPDGQILPFLIFPEGDQLMGQAGGQDAAPLKYLGDDTFGADIDPTVRIVFTVERGRVTRGKLLQRGAAMYIARRP
jgi:hypothetical protein